MTRLTDEQIEGLRQMVERYCWSRYPVLRALLDERAVLRAEIRNLQDVEARHYALTLAREKERDALRAKVLVYESDGNAAYMAGKSFMRGQLEPVVDALRDQLTRQRAEVLDEVETTLRNHGVSGAWLRARLREMKAQPPTSGSE